VHDPGGRGGDGPQRAQVLVEKNAGAGSGFADEAYAKAGAKTVDTPKEIFDAADMVMHVKEPLPPEYDLIREGQIVFTYLHLAADEPRPMR
jgi:alanine dehydrogenase